MSFHSRPTPGIVQLFTLLALSFLLVGAAMLMLARTVNAGAPLERGRSDTSLTPTPTPTCCNSVSGNISSYCDTGAYPYHYTFGLTNGCSITVTGSGGLSFQVSPNSTGPWSSPIHADFFNRPIPPGYSESSGSMWTGPLPQGNNWWRYGLYLSGQCWVVNITSAPQPACVGGTVTVTPVTATRTPTRTVTATATTCAAAGTPDPWVNRANYPEALSDIAVASDGTYLYGFAGRNSGGRRSSAYKYNYGTDTWTVLPTMIAGPSADLSAEYGNNGKIYVIGGASFGTANRIYDIASNSWSLGAPVPAYVSWYGSAYWNGKIYVIGGEGGSPSTGVHVYDTATDSWSTRAPLPQALYRMATVAINGRIYVANGYTGSAVTNTLYIYDINSNTWTTGPPSPLASSGPASTVIDGKLYMISGGSLDDGPHSVSSGTAQSSARAAASTPIEHTSTYLYDPVTSSWGAGPNLNTDHYRGGAATINTPGGETAIVVGGFAPPGWSGSVEASTLPVVPCATVTATYTVTRTATATTQATHTPTANVTPSATSSATPVCHPDSDYVTTVSMGATIVPGTVDVGNHCDDCTTTVSLPFTYYFYGRPFQTANLSSNGNLQFVSNNPAHQNSCLPATTFDYAIMPLWDDLRTDCQGQGIFTSVTGTAPNRIFNIEWRVCYLQGIGPDRFEVRLYEGANRFDVIYGPVSLNGGSSTVGTQKDTGSRSTQFSCNTAQITQGMQVSFYQPACSTGTPTSTTATPSSTAVFTAIPTTPTTPNNTGTPSVPTSTGTPTATSAPPANTPTVCPVRFMDVPSDHTFYPHVRCLACRDIVSGYADGTFKPDNLVTRGQLAKIVSNSANFTEPPGAQIFQDVAPDHTFYEWINRLTNRGHMSGYTCGGQGEPCVNNRPYFRPFANATRAQTSKIVSNAARYNDPPAGQTFEDVPPTHPFYVEIQRLAFRNIMGGYTCGGRGEPCVPPGNRPYFRPYNNVTRGQSAKIVANTF